MRIINSDAAFVSVLTLFGGVVGELVSVIVRIINSEGF